MKVITSVLEGIYFPLSSRNLFRVSTTCLELITNSSGWPRVTTFTFPIYSLRKIQRNLISLFIGDLIEWHRSQNIASQPENSVTSLRLYSFPVKQFRTSHSTQMLFLPSRNKEPDMFFKQDDQLYLAWHEKVPLKSTEHFIQHFRWREWWWGGGRSTYCAINQLSLNFSLFSSILFFLSFPSYVFIFPAS